MFLHGLFGRGKNFSMIAKGLQPEFRSLLVDLPNHGQSDWTEELDYLQLADQVAEHLKRGFAADGPVDVVGHSMGGKAAMALALTEPDRVARLIVADAAPVAYQHDQMRYIEAMRAVDLASIARRAQADGALAERVPEPPVRAFLLQSLAIENGRAGWRLNLDALSDALRGVPSEEGGRVLLILDDFRAFEARDPRRAEGIVEAIRDAAADHLEVGRRLLAFICTEETENMTEVDPAEDAGDPAEEWLRHG